MFTGIIEEIGEVKRIGGNKLTVKFNKISGIRLGDSIAVNGVCLTVQNLGKDFFEAGVMPVTLQKTNIKYLRVRDEVNLERAMRPEGFMGGHFVLGHVDGTGKVVKKSRNFGAVCLTIAFPKELSCYFVPQGPVAVDGVSLTIAEVGARRAVPLHTFVVSLVAMTIEATNLGNRKEGDILNLEADILAKYVQKQRVV